jgi:hypothetical protein
VGFFGTKNGKNLLFLITDRYLCLSVCLTRQGVNAVSSAIERLLTSALASIGTYTLHTVG